MSTRNMNRAKREKNDEFYTQLLGDIENEMRHYKSHFENKVIYMNTDHPDYSNFWLFFKLQFNHLKLKGIVSTFYSTDDVPFKTTYDGENEVRTPLKGNGDFRSDECVEILKEADIIITNPPFSLFREFLKIIIDNEKLFLIMGNMNAITYKETFPLIKNNAMWTGPGFRTSMEFEIPSDVEIKSKSGRVDYVTGKKYMTVQGITWFTNLDYPKRHEEMLLWASYEGSEHEYPEYDNIKAINIDKVANIPYDYEGVMGVPISFIGKWNPNQFEVLGFDYDVQKGSLQYLQKSDWDGPYSKGYIDGFRKYTRIFIRNKKPRKTLIPED